MVFLAAYFKDDKQRLTKLIVSKRTIILNHSNTLSIILNHSITTFVTRKTNNEDVFQIYMTKKNVVQREQRL